MSTTTVERKCLACGSTKLVFGKKGVHRHTFVPHKVMWTGYEIAAYVCLDCGAVGEYMDDKELGKLREEQAKKK